MEKFLPRTDLAREANARLSGSLDGVHVRREILGGFPVTRVKVFSETASDALCKPIGEYITLDMEKLLRREENAFPDCAHALGDILRGFCGNAGEILVIGLGNEAITPDAIGPWALNSVLVTRHLKERQLPDFAGFASVSAIRPGVLGTTGIEAARLTKLITEELKPEAVIVIDALASAEADSLCKTVQITDAGIVPGSGVGNARSELSRRTLGVPVIAIGVPTVVDASVLSNDFPVNSLIVTPRDIDKSARDAARLIGYAINLALHKGLTVEDVDMLIG